jgi:hypothetical protein
MFHHIWVRWASRTKNKAYAYVPGRRLDVFSYKSIMAEVKRRMGSYLESRKERMLARLGITGDRIRQYSIIGGGKEEEVCTIPYIIPIAF